MTDPTVVSGEAMDRRVERRTARWQKRYTKFAAAFTIAALTVVGWALSPSSSSLTVDKATIRTAVVTRSPFRDYIPLRAQVAPLRTVFVTSIAGGQVAKLAASDGQQVTHVAPLALLTNPQLELDVASRSAAIAGQLSEISAQRLAIQRTRDDSLRDVAAARNDLGKAETALRLKQVLFDKGVVTQGAIDPLRDEVAYQRSRLAALNRSEAQEHITLADQGRGIETTARQLRESLAMIRAGLAALVVRAPVAGRLTAFTLQPGQMVKPGDTVGQIDSDGEWKLTAEVDQFYLGRVHPGLTAVAEIDGRSLRVIVMKTLPQVTDGRFRVEFSFVGPPPPPLNRGQTLDVRLTLGADRPAVVAPAGGWLDAGGGTAFVLTNSQQATRRAISTGRRNPNQVEITAGLSPGERIITTSLSSYASYITLLIE